MNCLPDGSILISKFFGARYSTDQRLSKKVFSLFNKVVKKLALEGNQKLIWNIALMSGDRELLDIVVQ